MAVLMVVLVVLLTMVPSVHTYVWRNPLDHAIPAALADPPGTLRDHYAQAYKAQQWGGPQVDGPDRLLPHSCYWFEGVLHCGPLLCAKG